LVRHSAECKKFRIFFVYIILINIFVDVKQLKTRIMKDLSRDCQECNGWGTITIEHNGTEIPYLQDIVDYECMSCTGTGEQLDPELVQERIEEVNDMILGMQTRMRMHSDFIMQLKKGYLNELANKYNDRLDTCARALGRLMNYKRKLHNLVAN
jgi:hypothetical protein